MHPKSEPQDTFNWLINDMVNNVHAAKIINFLPVIKSSDVVTFMTLFNTSFHEKVKLGTMYHSKTPQDIKDNIMFFPD